MRLVVSFPALRGICEPAERLDDALRSALEGMSVHRRRPRSPLPIPPFPPLDCSSSERRTFSYHAEGKELGHAYLLAAFTRRRATT